jgi:acyl carrier protein
MTEATIREVLANHGHLSEDVSRIARDADLYAAGLTSHASVNVMLGLEDAFDVEFPEHMLRKATFSSIGMIQDAIDQLLEKAS